MDPDVSPVQLKESIFLEEMAFTTARLISLAIANISYR